MGYWTPSAIVLLTPPKPCGPDERYGTMVHRYNMGSRVCRCGRDVTPKSGGTSTGWATKKFQKAKRGAKKRKRIERDPVPK